MNAFYEYLTALNEFKFDFSLSRIKDTLRFLKNPQNAFEVIHITGSNGKGSIATYIAGIFKTHGIKTGLYTSPHFRNVRERIAVNGRPVALNIFLEQGTKLKNLIESKKIKLTYFEFLTVLAFMIFKLKKVKVGVVEVGLGGRYDATNVVYKNKLLSIISSVSKEHTEYLGNTLLSILKEKEQIIGAGKCVTGIKNKELKAYLKKTHKTRVVFANEKYDIFKVSGAPEGLKIKMFDKTKKVQISLTTKMLEPVQAENIRVVLAVVEELKNRWKLNSGKVFKAIATVSVTGRMSSKKGVYLSVAHNPEAVERMLEAVALLHTGKKIKYIFSVLKDKNIDEIMKIVAKNKNISIIITSIKDNPRAMDTAKIVETANKYKIKNVIIKDLSELKKFVNKKKDSGIIIIGGSFYLVKEFI